MAAAVVAVSLMLMAVSAFAQEGAMSPYQDEQDGRTRWQVDGVPLGR